MRKWRGYLLMLIILLAYGLVGAIECDDHDRLAKRQRPKYPPPIYTAEAGR